MSSNDSTVQKKPNMAVIMSSYPNSFLRDHVLDTFDLPTIPFGRELKNKEFGLKKETIFLNHGSYGTVPNRILALQHQYNEEREEHPDLFYRLNARQYLNKARQDVADFVNADVEDIMMVTNATTAMNLLLKNYPFKAGEAILDTTTTYGAVKNLVYDTISRIRPDVQRIHMSLTFPIHSKDEIIAKYKQALDENPCIKVAVVDHITSPTSMVMPISELITLCHSRGVLVFVDGAHSIGQLPLDFGQLKPDAFTSNLHKWCFAPRGCAMLWFDRKHRSWLHPPNTSWQLMETLELQFFDQGTRDHVPFICGRHGLQFYKAIGGMSKIANYNSDLADKATSLLCERFGLTTLEMPSELQAPYMRLIKLPRFPDYDVNEENTWILQKELFGASNIFGILCPIQGEFYIRFSTQVYNEIDDFHKLADILEPFLEKFMAKSP